MLSIHKSLMVITLMLFNPHQAISSQIVSFSSIVINANYTEEYQCIINSTVEYVFLYPVSNVSIRILYNS